MTLDLQKAAPLGCSVLVPATREEWLTERQRGIGGSDAPSLLGQGYRSLLELWCDKTGRTTAPDEPNYRLSAGHALEPLVAEMAETRMGVQLTDPGDYTIFQMAGSGTPCFATLDRVILSDAGLIREPVELKTSSYFMRPQWDGEPPLYPQLQLQWQLMVTGLQVGHIACLFGLGEDEAVYTLERNPAVIDLLHDRAEKFWQCVRTDTPPEADGTKGAERALKLIYPRDTGRVVALADEYGELLAARQALEAEIEQREKALGKINNKFREALADASWGLLPGGEKVVSWRLETRRMPPMPARTIQNRILRIQKRPKDLTVTEPTHE